MFNFSKYDLDTRMKLNESNVMVGDIIAKSSEGVEDSYYMVKVITNQRQEFINYKNGFSGRKDIFNYVVVPAKRENSNSYCSCEYNYKVIDDAAPLALIDFLKNNTKLKVVDSVIMFVIH